MLSYCIIEALSDPEKSKQKEEDTNISWWFQVCPLLPPAAFVAGLSEVKSPQSRSQSCWLLWYALNTYRCVKDQLFNRKLAIGWRAHVKL